MFDTNTVTEKFAALNKANTETALSFANIALDSAARLMDLQLSAAKAMVTDSTKTAKIISQVKDAQGLMALQSELVQPSVEKAVEYSRSVYEIATQTQGKIGQILEERASEFSQEVVAAMEQAVKAAPAGVGADAAVAAMKSAVSAATSAYGTMSKTAKQVADLAEANVTAITSKAVASNHGPKRKAA